MVERLFLAMPRGCLQFVIVVFPDHTHLLFFLSLCNFQHHILEKKRHMNLLPLVRINFVQKANSVAPSSAAIKFGVKFLLSITLKKFKKFFPKTV